MKTANVMSDRDDREIARAEVDKNMLVIAGAGTGKTTLLIDRLIFLILGKQVPVEQIVAMTFTRKAAEEMRDRLEERLRGFLKEGASFPELERKYPASKPLWPVLAQAALDDIPKSQIGTIHSFAAHLLRLYPLQARVDPRFMVDMGFRFETVFNSEWEKWVETELGAENVRSRAWAKLLGQTSLGDLRVFAEALCSPLVDGAQLKGGESPVALAKAGLFTLTAIQQRNEVSKRATKFNPAFEALISVYEFLSDGKEVDSDLLESTEGAKNVPSAWESDETEIKALVSRARRLAQVDDALIESAVERMMPLIQSIRAEMGRSGIVSSDGLLVFARNLVRDHPQVRTELKKKFTTFLVDEFQDTDPLQTEILFYLAESVENSAGHWRKVTLGPGRLFVVGDPKQSIYRFRGADMAAFEEVQEKMEAQGAPTLRLTSNFRSRPEILNLVNAIFPSIMMKTPYLQPDYIALEPGREPTETEKEPLLLIQAGGEAGAKLLANHVREAEAAAIADWIQKKNDIHSYRDIALLFRSANSFQPYLDEFRARGIPYLAEGEKSFYRTSEVSDFLNLLAAVADPDDQLSLVGFLRSPFAGFTDIEILELKPDSKTKFTYQSPGKVSKKMAAVFSLLNELHKLSEQVPLSQIIGEAARRFWVLETASSYFHADQAIANLEKIRLLAEKWSVGAPMTLKDFVKRFSDYRDDERDEGENPLADAKYDAVKVMTMHKAKGLEFPVVFLPNLNAMAKNSDGFNRPVLLRDWRTERVGLRLTGARKTNATMALIEEEVKKREEAEEVRVFYVAATRARDKLVLLTTPAAKNPGLFGGYLKKGGLDSLNLPALSAPVVTDRTASYKRVQPVPVSGWDVEKLKRSFDQRESALPAAQSERMFASPSSLMKEAEKGIVVDEEARLRREAAQDLGVLCHKVMEEWDFSVSGAAIKAQLTAKHARACRLLELLDDNPADRAVMQESRDILESFFSSSAYANLQKVKIRAREVPFFFPDGGVMNGIIDMIYEEKGKLVIADYKTNRVDEKILQKTVEHYRIQGDVYRKAAKLALGQDAEFELIFLRNGKSIRV